MHPELHMIPIYDLASRQASSRSKRVVNCVNPAIPDSKYILKHHHTCLLVATEPRRGGEPAPISFPDLRAKGGIIFHAPSILQLRVARDPAARMIRPTCKGCHMHCSGPSLERNEGDRPLVSKRALEFFSVSLPLTHSFFLDRTV